MIQSILVYCLLAVSLGYVAYRIYGTVKKKQACDKCELMKAAKASPLVKKNG